MVQHPDTFAPFLTHTPMHIYKKSEFFIKNSNFACSPSMNSLPSTSPVKPTSMRRFVPLLFILTIALPAFVNAQSVTSNPVGFNTVTVNINTTRALSLPFNKPPDFGSAVSAVTSSTIQTTNAGWGANAFAPFVGNPGNPHVVRMTTGAAIGKQFRILSNTADTLTVVSGTDLTGVAAGDQYQIFATETLQSLFGANGQNNGQAVNTSGDSSVADNILLRTGSSWNTYFNDGTQWLKQGTGSPSNTVAIPPEQGFVFVHRGGTAYSFTSLGAVPITNLKTDFAANSTSSFGNRFPLDTTLAGLGLDQLAGWNKNSDPTLADNVLIRIGSTWSTFYHDGTQWLKQGTGSPSNAQAIATGTSVVVVRRGGSLVTLDQPLPYSLN
jgi:uncharacterized protein (TIGR02597 family)